MKKMKVWDYVENYDGHMILKDENGKELVNTVKSHGEFPFDVYPYEVVEIVREVKKFGIVVLAELIVRR